MTPVALGTLRFQAAIAGRVLDAQSLKPAAGIRVQITAMPAAFQAILDALALQHGASWSAERRPDVARSELDGVFHFGDLPNGDYELTLTLPGGDARYGTATAIVTVSHAADGTVTTPFLSVSIPPTAVTGTILRLVPPQGNQQPTTAPLRMARVRVRGTGEATYSSAAGTYYLTGADPGPQMLELSAPGYVPASIAVAIQRGVVVAAPAVTLNPAP